MIGQTISHYRILEKLGEGGMGIVYKAQDTRLDRLVALKFLPHHLTAGEEEQARFLQEARAAAILNHPNVCTIYDIKEEEGQQFIVMEYVDGVTLREKILRRGEKTSPLQVNEAVSFANQIAEALHEAHSKGIVHRDIKSENIMVNSKNQIKVMDFGLAKLKDSLRLTKVSTTVGTLGYMAPELIQGGEADARSDIFSFGVVMFEMLTGRLPFRGDHEAAMMYSILNEEPDPLTRYRDDSPSKLTDIVYRLLQKNPAQRYQATHDVLNDLKKIAASAEDAKGAAPTSIAVLAFEDMSPNKDQEHLCEGLAEEIINALTKIRTLHVSARTSAFAFQGKQMDIREIGGKLNVQTVLEGSVRKSGNRLRITAQLINIADGYHLWSERYDREMRDVFEIQDEITENIVRALKLVLTEKEKESIAVALTPEIEAYEYYLRGRRLLHLHRKKHEESIKMFTQATQIDPQYAPAYSGLADCYAFRYMYWESTETNLHECEKASRKAIEINPRSAEAHTSLGLVFSMKKQYIEAEREFETSIRLNPRLFEVYYYYGRTCFARGEFEHAAKLFEEAVRVRPDDYQVPVLLTSVYRSLKDEAKYREAIGLALQKVERHIELTPDDARAYYMGGGVLALMGEGEKGEQWIARALALEPDNPGTLYNVACFYSQRGKVNEAIGCLQQAIGHGFAHREWIEQDSDLDPLRDDQRFQGLLARMKAS
jgi:serine/threonine protein kinase/Tfp pilus assembly protein PilF